MDNFIEVYKNVFDDKFCEEAMQSLDTYIESGLAIPRNRESEGNSLDKDDLSIFLPVQHTNQHLTDEFTIGFWKRCYNHYAEKYSILDKLHKHNVYTMKIQKTKPGQGYHTWHCETDGIDTAHRLLVYTVYLNDTFDAGETEFIYQQYRYKPSKGDVIIFPAAFTHVHRGNPPIGGDKYIITGWVEF